MTTLGKFFTLGIFIMSLLFLYVSASVFTVHKNWKMVAINPRVGEANHDSNFDDGLRWQIEDTRKALNELKTQKQELLAELQRERAARRMAIQQLQTKNATLAAAADELTRLYNDESAKNQSLIQQVDVKEDRLASLTTQVETLQSDIQAAQQSRDEEFQRVVTITDQLHQFERDKRNLEERVNQLAHEVTQRKRVMDHIGVTPDTPLHNQPPRVEGEVTVVSAKNNNLVEISLGEDDGIRVDHELVVYRDNTYVAKIKIRKVGPNVAVGEIEKDTRRGTVKKGDNVTTRFS